jgi:flagellar P-ring protein precursor FlgI
MRRILSVAFAVIGLISVLDSSAVAASRIKDVAVFEGVRDNQLVGYGLVVGLNGTGDRNQTFFSTQTLANMLERSGVTVNPQQVRVKNIAAVMVTANLPPFVRQGSRIDVTVSSIGDAQSIQGGVLILTTLHSVDSMVYATAQGPVAISGYSATGATSRALTNHPTVGRVPNGALVEREVPVDLAGKTKLNLVLHSSDFTTAARAVRSINAIVGTNVAAALDGRTITVSIPSEYANRTVEFMAMVENAKMDVDVPARVILNEKTGTIVMGKEVKVAEVSIIHGTLSVQVGTLFSVSQPTEFSLGQTQVVPESTVTTQEDKKTVTLRDGATVEEVVRGLTAIGAGPRDIIAILQAIKAQGALQAELEII